MFSKTFIVIFLGCAMYLAQATQTDEKNEVAILNTSVLDSYATSIEKVKFFITTTFNKALEVYQKVYDKFVDTTKKVSDYSKVKLEQLKAKYHAIKDAAEKKVVEITKAAVSKIGQGCTRILKNSAQMIAGKTTEVARKIKERISNSIKSLINNVRDRMNEVIRQQIEILKERFRQWGDEAYKSLTKKGKKFIEGIIIDLLPKWLVPKKSVEEYDQAEQKGIQGHVEDVVEAGKKQLKTITHDLVDTGKKILHEIPVIGGAIDAGKKTVEKIEAGKKKIKDFAEGATHDVVDTGKKIINRIPVLGGAIEAGKKTVEKIEAEKKKIKDFAEGATHGIVDAGKKIIHKIPVLGGAIDAGKKTVEKIEAGKKKIDDFAEGAKKKADSILSGIGNIIG